MVKKAPSDEREVLLPPTIPTPEILLILIRAANWSWNTDGEMLFNYLLLKRPMEICMILWYRYRFEIKSFNVIG